MPGWCVRAAVLVVLLTLVSGLAPTAWPQPVAPRRPVSIDDLMALSTINDVEIAPAGDRVAYTVSTPSLPTNTHETAALRRADRRRRTDAARRGRAGLRARAAGAAPALVARRPRVSFLGLADGRPQVFAVGGVGRRRHGR